MNAYRILTQDDAGLDLATTWITARSLEVAAVSMRAALRANRRVARTELWLDDQRVAVIVRRRNRFVMTEDEPRASMGTVPRAER
jgi:hypothetical protein